jgi:DNA-binding transcriptional ArsR family regulator
MSEEQVRLSAQTLRGIAHPLRVRLLSLLREEGPSTATRLAQRSGQSSGATSYHLRQLAAYGFVIEDETEGTGRERWWRAANRLMSLSAEDAREAPVEAEAYLRSVATQYAERMNRWVNEAPTMPPEWDRGATLSNWQLRLTPDEASRFLAEFETLVGSYRHDEPEAEAPDDAERVAVQLQVMPFLVERTPS